MGVPGRLSSDRKDSAHKLIIGVQVNEYIALEAQYLDLGKSEYKSVASWDGGAGFEKEKLQLKTTGFGFNVVGSYPVTESFNVFAKTGLHQLKSKVSWREVGGHTGLGETWSDKASSSNSKWIHSIGVGASYELIPDLALVGEYERYRNTAKDIKIGSEKLGLKHNIDLLSVGLRYSF